MSRNVDQRNNFIAEYAAKRQGQMDRARQLREQRGGGGQGSNPSTPLAQHHSNTIDQRPPGYQGGYQEDLPARPQNLKAPSSYEDAPRGQLDYPPSLKSTKPPPLTQSHISQPSTGGVVEVSEAHFREATQRGIITPDQARQLWAVLSDQAVMVAPQNQKSNMPRQQEQTRPTQPQQGMHTYNPSQYAPPQQENPNIGTYRGSYAHQLTSLAQPHPLDDDESMPADYGQPSKVSKSLASRVAGAKKLPEWNNDFTEGSDTYYDQPPPSRDLKQATPRTTPKQAPPPKRKPDWNDDSEMNYGEPPAPPQPKVRPQPKPAVAAAPAASRARRPNEDASPPLDQVVPSKRPTEVPQRNAPPSSQRGVPQRGGRQQQPEPEPEVVVQDPREVAEFMRQKEEARRQFEEALAEAEASEPLIECNTCGRRFRETVIDRHESTCTGGKKRKVFDSKKSRLEGIDGMEDVLRQQVPRRGERNPSKQAAQPAAPAAAAAMPKWKIQHLQFQNALKAISGGAPAPAAPDDRVTCPHCSRRFAAESAQRHIPHCATTINKPKGLVRPGGKR